MAKADSVYITPPTNTSAIDHPMMFPPRDPTRRRFLTVAAVASVVSAGSLAAAAAMEPSVPKAVTVPRHSGPDPVFALIADKRAADIAHGEAIDAEEEAEEHGIGLDEASDRCLAACHVTHAVDWKLATTPPTTLAGVAAVLRFANEIEDGGMEWPDTDAVGREGWHYQLRATMAAAIEALIKAPGREGDPVMRNHTAQIIQLPRSKGDKTGRKARRVLDTQKTPATSSLPSDIAENFRLRQDRYYDWREASAVMDYWRAAMKMKSAISCMQNYGTPEGDMYPFVKAEDHRALVAKWRLAWCKLMLTPAPNAREVTWKRAQLEAENWKYTGLSAKRIEQAIADDVEWLTAHPTRRPRKRDQEQ